MLMVCIRVRHILDSTSIAVFQRQKCLRPSSGVPLWLVCIFLQERQRLETILNLCAEYNKGESTSLETLGSARTGFPGVLGDGLGQRPSVDSVLGGTPSSATLRLLQKQRESDEENLKEECSSTESTHQEVRTSPAPSTASALHNGDRQVRGDARFPTALHATVEAACANDVLGFVKSAVLEVSFWGFSVVLKKVRRFWLAC